MEEPLIESWIIHCDDAWCKDGVGIAAILETPSGAKTTYAGRLNFVNPDLLNTTEYEALLLGLRKMKALGHKKFHHKIRFQDHQRSDSDFMYFDCLRDVKFAEILNDKPSLEMKQPTIP